MANRKPLVLVSGEPQQLQSADSLVDGSGNPVGALLITATAAKSADFTVATSDKGKLHKVTTGTSTITATLPAAATAGDGWYCFLEKHDTGTGVIATSAATLNPTLLSLMEQYDVVIIWTDGTSYYGAAMAASFHGFGGSGGATGGSSSSSTAEDPIYLQHGTPTTAYEFDSTSISGTAIGTAGTENANTSVVGAYYVKKANSASTDFTGRVIAAPAAPFTLIAKILGYSPVAPFSTFDFAHAGCTGIAEATPGKMEFIQYVYITGSSGWNLYHTQIASPTGAVTNVTNSVSTPAPFFWFAIRVNSATSVDFLVSNNGRFWKAVSSARNPGFTIGNVCFGTFPEAAANYAACAWDFIRIFNSALTLAV